MNQNKDKQTSIAALILASGASRRMGQPKQLLPYKGQNLLNHVINSALASTCSSVIVILGANADRIEPEITQLPITIVKNTKWHEGMSSSIVCGIAYLQEQLLNLDGVVFLTCDQPFISAKIIDKLIDAYNSTNKPIIASYYETNLGIPVLFSRSFFSGLKELKGDRGAKKNNQQISRFSI